MAESALRSPTRWTAAAVLIGFGLVPVYAALAGAPYQVTLFLRIMIYALAALSLNFLLGVGGLVSFGHALYLGIGAYGVSILQYYGLTSGVLQLAAALATGAVFALAIGAVVVRLSGMTFIMITLAFAQMGYFLAVSLKTYGGEDGRSIDIRSTLGPLDLSGNITLYYVVFAALLAALWVYARMAESRFGMVLRGCRSNERRMLALGFPTFRYKLLAYVLSALGCVLAGFFLANLTSYASPSYMQWTVSAELIIMALLGGIGTLFGPVAGALVFLLLEEVLGRWKPGVLPPVERLVNDHFLALIGLFIILVVLTARRGLYGWLAAREAR